MISKETAETLVDRWAYDCSKFIRTHDDSFVLASVKKDWSTRRKCHRGGWYAKGAGINMAMYLLFNCYRLAEPVMRFMEYPSFNNHSVIGGFYYTDVNLKAQTMVCHEMAHAWQFHDAKKNNTRFAPHGVEFKQHYATLRKKFINHKVENQEKLLAIYSRDLPKQYV